MYCPKCSEYVNDNEYYCPKCGKQLKHDLPASPYTDVTISMALRNFIKKGFSTEGVACLKEFLVIAIIHFLITFVFTITRLDSLNIIFSIIIFIPFLTLICRRLHDIDKSGVYCLLYGYSLIAYMSRAFVSQSWLVYFLFFSSIITYIIMFCMLIKPTNPKSKWNPYNGYM